MNNNNSNNHFIIVAPLSAISTRTRLFKLTKFLISERKVYVTHFAWERVLGESDEKGVFDIKKRILLRGGGYGNTKIKLLYFIWMIKVFLSSFFIKKNTKVWALGFESAFPL